MVVLQSSFAIFIGLVVTIQQPKQTEATHNSLGSPPLFVSQHPNVYVYQTDKNGNRQNLILPCSVDNSTMNYTWFREDQELPGTMVNREGSLVIPNITEGEYASREGVDYYCIASENIGFDIAIRSRTITVFYTYFDGFGWMAKSGTINISIPVALNSDVALECDVLDAKPPPQIKWYNDQGLLRENNGVRFLDGGRYLYLTSLEPSHLERQYYCAVTNVNLNQEMSAPTRYVLTDNLTQGVLVDYKQIGDLTAFVGNTSVEFAYVGGVFGNNTNGTANALLVDGGDIDVLTFGPIGVIDLTTITLKGVIMLVARVIYNGMIAVRRGTLTIQQVPRIINNLQNEREHFTLEENITYTCEFEGSPLPNVTFYFNGRQISTADTDLSIFNNILIIPSPQVSHSGIYQCIVSNEFGDDQAAWLLEIREPSLPQVRPYNLTALDAFDDRDLGALIVRENSSTVSFFVDVVADPCPYIVWLFNGTRLGPSNETFTYNNACAEAGASSPNWTFTLSVLLTAATSGSYTAKFTNIAGSVSLPKAYFTLPESVAIVGLSLNETCLKEGSNISLHCDNSGLPRPRIKFQHNGTEIVSGTDLYTIEFYDQILITNITMSAAGRYTCIAISEQGLQTQVTEQFDFCTVPVITGTNLTSNPQFGQSFFIECTVEGIPMPIISWMKDGAILDEITDSRIRIVTIAASSATKSSRVEIFEATSSYNGVYECIASNKAGSASASFVIEQLQAGSSDITVSASLSDSIELIVGITVGVTVLISAALFVVLILICLMCRLCINDKNSKPQIASTKSYTTNIAYTGNIEHLCELPDPLYDTIPYSDPAEVQTNEKIYKRAHVYEKIYEDIELTEHPTVNPTSGNAMKNISPDEILVSQNDDNNNPIESSHNEDNGKPRSPKMENQVEQETTLHPDPQKSKCPHSDHESEAKGSMIKEHLKAGITPNDDVNKDVEMDNDKPSQIYTSISAEHKAKKQKKMLQKQKKEDQKEVNKMEEKMEGKGLEKDENIATDHEKEYNEDERNKANLSKEENISCAEHSET